MEEYWDEHYPELRIDEGVSGPLQLTGPFGPVKEGLNGVNRRKTAKNLVDSRKNLKILTVSRK